MQLNLSGWNYRGRVEGHQDGELIKLGKHKLRFLEAPHVHHWDSMMLFDETKGPLGIRPGLGAVMIGHAVITFPYTVLVLLPRLASIDRSLDDAARDLGASALYAFMRVTLPLTLSAVVAALLISFVLSIDEFAIASFLVGNTTTYPVYLFSQLRFASRLPLVIAFATVMIAFTFLVVISAEVIRRRGDRKLAQRPPRMQTAFGEPGG